MHAGINQVPAPTENATDSMSIVGHADIYGQALEETDRQGTLIIGSLTGLTPAADHAPVEHPVVVAKSPPSNTNVGGRAEAGIAAPSELPRGDGPPSRSAGQSAPQDRCTGESVVGAITSPYVRPATPTTQPTALAPKASPTIISSTPSTPLSGA